jgi:hypothetical protein
MRGVADRRARSTEQVPIIHKMSFVEALKLCYDVLVTGKTRKATVPCTYVRIATSKTADVSSTHPETTPTTITITYPSEPDPSAAASLVS